MSIIQTLIKAKQLENNALRKVYFPENSYLKMLKPSVTAREFEVLETYYFNWYLKYSDFRQSFVLTLAIDEPFSNDKLPEATHLSINEEVYVITQGETMHPIGETPFWAFFCERFAGQNQYTALY